MRRSSRILPVLVVLAVAVAGRRRRVPGGGPRPRIPAAARPRRRRARPTTRRSAPSRPTAAPSRCGPTRCSPASGAVRPISGAATSTPRPTTFARRPRSTPRRRGRSKNSATSCTRCSATGAPPKPTRARWPSTIARPASATSWPCRATAPASSTPPSPPRHETARLNDSDRRGVLPAGPLPARPRGGPPRRSTRSSRPSRCRPASSPRAKNWPTSTPAQSRRADELDQLQVLAGLDRDHVERQIAVGLAQARAGHAEPAVVALGTALERTPDQPLVYEALGRVWLEDAEARDDRVGAEQGARSARTRRLRSRRRPARRSRSLAGRCCATDRSNAPSRPC